MNGVTSRTADEWHLRFLEILAGSDAELDVERIGGIEQYVLAEMRRSPNPAAERLVIADALQRLFRAESLLATRSSATSNLLDLAAAFKTDAAVPQLLAFAREHVRDPYDYRFGTRTVDLRLRALQALETYFPAPELDDSLAFAAYRRVLEMYLEVVPLRGYAIARLCEIEGDVFGRVAVTSAILRTTTPELADLIRRLLHHNSEGMAERCIGAVRRILTPTKPQAFEQAIVSLGGKVKPAHRGLAITLPGPIVLLLGDQLVDEGVRLQNSKQDVPMNILLEIKGLEQ